MYTKFIPKNIQEKLKAKERALAYKEPSANVSNTNPIKPQDIQSRTTFVRMCSNKVDAIDNILISGGKAGDFDGKSRFGLNEAIDGGDLYQKRKSGIRPVAGIKSIEVNYKGSYKAIREATVNWIVGSIEELDELTPYFLTVGKTVALDWGWVNSNVKNFAQMYDDTPFITWQEGIGGAGRYNVDQRIFTDAQGRVQRMGGDYDALGGKISNFEMTMRPDGGFDCVTKITAVGSTLFSKPIDRPTNQISLVPKPMTDEEKELLKKGTSDNSDEQQRIDELQERITTDKKGDNIINAIINLPDIIKHTILGWPEEGGELTEFIKNKGFLNFKKNISTGKTKYKSFQNKLYHIDVDHGIAVDNHKNSQVCWMNIKNQNKFFVKWGYMEDQIFNRYLAYDAGEGEANDLKITFRSIKTRIDKEGKPISNDLYKEDLDNMPEDGEGTVLLGNDTPNTGKYTVVSGDTLSGIAGRYKTTVDILVDLNSDIQDSSSIINVGQEIILPQSTQEQEDFELLEGMTDDELFGPGSMILRPEIQDARDRPNNEFMSSLSSAWNLGDEITLIDYPFSDKMPSADVYEFKKESTKIRSCYGENNFFYPIDAFKFWSPELLPPIDRIGFPGGISAAQDNYLPEFKRLYKKLKEDPKQVFSVNKFTSDDNSSVGSLRNMWVNVEEIQKAFGVDISNKKEPKANPPGTFENGVKALLQSLNSNFYGVWDFELAVDPYDSTNMGVIDKKVNVLGKNSLNYTTFISDVEGSSVPDKEGNFSHRVNDLGIYKFPSFKAGSIVKNQNLSFKIPDAMALTILYGSNKPEKTETSNAAYNNPEIMKLFSRQDSKFDDKYLIDMMPAHLSTGGSIIGQKVGSHKTNPNSKIIRDSEHGITIDTNLPWYKQWSGDTQIVQENSEEFIPPKIQLSFDTDNNIVQIIEAYKEVPGEPLGEELEPTTKVVRDESRKGQFDIKDEKPQLFAYSQNKGILKIRKDAEKLVRSRLNGSLKVEENDYLKVDTIIPAELTLEIDGIGGVSPGDLVHTNYIQKEYGVEIFDDNTNYGPYTYFQVLGLNQRVDSATWSTEVVTKMRINHIPDKENLRASTETIKRETPKPIKRPKIPVPSDNEDIADDLTLDDLDFDDFSNLPAPPPPPPVSRPPTPVPSDTEVDIGDVLKNLDTSFNVLEDPVILPIPPKPVPIPDVAKPVIPVPMDEQDLENYKTDFLDNFEFPNFDDWEKPPAPPKPIVEKKKQRQKKKEPLVIKSSKKEITDLKDVYKGTYEQNEVLYSIREDWRPLYLQSNGQPGGGKTDTLLRNQQSFDTRKEFFHKYIEEPNESGVSRVNTTNFRLNTTPILIDGLLRSDRSTYWYGQYNPDF